MSALDTEGSRSLLFNQQSLMSAAAGKTPVQVIFPDSTTSIAVPVSSMRDGFTPAVTRRVSVDEEDATSTVLDEKEDIILLLTGSREGDEVVRSLLTLVLAIILLQLLLIGVLYSGEVPSEWQFNDNGAGAGYSWIICNHLLFLLGAFTRSIDLLALYGVSLGLSSLYGLMNSISSALDVIVLFLSIPIFLLTYRIRNLIGPQCMYSSNRPE